MSAHLAHRRSPARLAYLADIAAVFADLGPFRFAQWYGRVATAYDSRAAAQTSDDLAGPAHRDAARGTCRLLSWRATNRPWTAPATWHEANAERTERLIRGLWSRDLYAEACSVLAVEVGPPARVIHDSVSGFAARLAVPAAWRVRVFARGLALFGDRLVLDAEPAEHAHVPAVYDLRRISYVERVGKRIEMRQCLVYRHPLDDAWHRYDLGQGPIRLLREAKALGLIASNVRAEDPAALARTPELDSWVEVRVAIPAETYTLVRMDAAEQAGVLPSVGEHIARIITDRFGPVRWDTLMRALAIQDPRRRPPPAAAAPAHERDEWRPVYRDTLPDDDR